MSNKFDKNKFASLLSKACGNMRSQKDFAKAAGISIPHLNKLMNAKFDSAPNVRTIEKIAAVSTNGVTYKDLLEAAGYDASLLNSYFGLGYSDAGFGYSDAVHSHSDAVHSHSDAGHSHSGAGFKDTYMVEDSNPELAIAGLSPSGLAGSESKIHKNAMLNILVMDIAQKTELTILSRPNSEYYDKPEYSPNMHISIKKDEFKDWYIFAQYVPAAAESISGISEASHDNRPGSHFAIDSAGSMGSHLAIDSANPNGSHLASSSSNDLNENSLFANYAISFLGKCAFIRGTKKRPAKVSLVTNSKAYADYLASHSFSVANSLSVILVDLPSSKVIFEKSLHTALT